MTRKPLQVEIVKPVSCRTQMFMISAFVVLCVLVALILALSGVIR